MTDFAARTSEPVGPGRKLVVKEANAEIRRLYVRLFGRSVLLAGAVFAVVRSVVFLGVNGWWLFLILAFVGNGLVAGALVEVVRDLHEDGDRTTSATEMLERAWQRLGQLCAVSLLAGLGIGIGFLFLLVPGFVLMVRWSVAVPVVMIEGKSAREALRRSRELVRGNGRAVLNVMLAVNLLTGLVVVVFASLGRSHGLLGVWLGGVIGAALTAPYAAHAVTVLYYRLVDPERPAALPRGERWQSIWEEERAGA